jgi:hypothetical protein
LKKKKRAIMAPSKANSPEYAKDEKVLCFHLELLYEAKVLDLKPKDPNDKGDGYVYRIHYKGWKNTYVFCPFALLIFVFLGLVSSAVATATATSIERHSRGAMMMLSASCKSRRPRILI